MCGGSDGLEDDSIRNLCGHSFPVGNFGLKFDGLSFPSNSRPLFLGARTVLDRSRCSSIYHVVVLFQ
jgi:hypothetical protein